MSVNKYFNQTTRASEQNLLQDLWDEAIQIHGHEVYYIMREGDDDVDKLFGEHPLAKFKQAFSIEMFVKSFQNFAGDGDFLSKFGLNIQDQCQFSVSVRRFDEVVKIVRPREGDYIFIQMTPNAAHAGLTNDSPHRMVFEIKKVDDKEDGLFQLGEHYTWQLTTELVTYSHERVETGIDAIDSTPRPHAYTIELPLGSGDGAYLVGETVYQGLSFVGARATAKVTKFDTATMTLSVQDVAGAFNETDAIVGVTSDASYVPTNTPVTAPTVSDAISDNETLDDAKTTVVTSRGSNPRFQ